VGSVQNRGPVREKGESGIKKVLVLILLMLSMVMVSLLLA